MSKKPLASARTIDMFTGKSGQEVADEAERIRQGLDNLEHTKERGTIAEAANESRERAFQGQDWTSKHFGRDDAEDNQYRTSLKNGYLYLEKMGANRSGPFSYAGIMFPEQDAPKMATVLVAAAKAYLAKASK